MTSLIVIKSCNNLNKVIKLKKIDCTSCHRYRLNSAGFLFPRDMFRTFNIRFSLKTTVLIICIQCIDEVVVSNLVYRFLVQNVFLFFF